MISDDVRLLIGRAKFPQWAEQERTAWTRVRDCTVRGDIAGGAHALADWIEARTGMTVYALFDNHQN